MDQITAESCQWGKLSRSRHDNFLLDGPAGRIRNFFLAISIFREFLKGFRKFHFIGPCVTVFGSARIDEESRYYQLAREISGRLAGIGFTIMTGGGPGIMEAANRGAKEAGGYSVGCNIKLPKEQHPNKYLNKWVEFNHFFIRKVMLLKYSYAFVVLPGGFGTFDEMFETLTLIQTGKIRNFPIVLVGREYWDPLVDFLNNLALKNGFIQKEDLQLLFLTDSAEEAVARVVEYATSSFGFSWELRRKPRWWLFEK